MLDDYYDQFAKMVGVQDESTAKFAVALVIVALALTFHSRLSKSGPPLPPGPKGWPIVGSMFEMPQVVRPAFPSRPTPYILLRAPSFSFFFLLVGLALAAQAP